MPVVVPEAAHWHDRDGIEVDIRKIDEIVVFAGTDSVDIVVATIISVVVVVGGARDEAGGAHPTGESRGSLSMLLLLID